MDNSATPAVARLCRAYIAFLAEPNKDALFNWSNSLHSMHDRVPTAMKSDLFERGEFVALKALRNHFHHGGEVVHCVKPLVVGNLPLKKVTWASFASSTGARPKLPCKVSTPGTRPLNIHWPNVP